MIYSNLKQKLMSKGINKQYLYFFIGVVICFLVGHIWIRDTSNKASIDLAIQIDKLPKGAITFFNLVAGKHAMRLMTYLVSILLLNFSNIFKLLLYYIIIYLIIGTSALLKLSYRHEMLFILADQMEIDIELNECSFSWSTASTRVMGFTSLIMSLWYITSSKLNLFYRYLTLGLVIILLCFYSLCVFTLKLYTINDIVFSNIIGLFIFFFFVQILNLDLNKSKDMRDFMGKCTIAYTIFNIIVIVSSLTLYFLSDVITPNTEYYKNVILKTSCGSHTDITDLNLESFIQILMFLTNFVVFLAIYLDLKFFSAVNSQKWGIFNFDNDQNDLASLYTINSDNQVSQWNSTTCCKTTLRLIISIALMSLSSIPYLLIKDSSNIFLVVLKYLIPYAIENFCLLFLLKFIFIKLNLVNLSALKSFTETLKHEFSVEEDSEIIE